jgi:hypothetical protein
LSRLSRLSRLSCYRGCSKWRRDRVHVQPTRLSRPLFFDAVYRKSKVACLR